MSLPLRFPESVVNIAHIRRLMAVANAAFQRLLEFWNNQISIAQR